MKQKATDFYQNVQVKSSKISKSKNSDESLEPQPGQMKNMFYSKDKLSNLCTGGVIRNLMNLLHYSAENMTVF